MRKVYTYRKNRLDGPEPAKIREQLTPEMARPYRLVEIEKEIRARATKSIKPGNRVRLIENPAGRWHTLWIGGGDPERDGHKVIADGTVHAVNDQGHITAIWTVAG